LNTHLQQLIELSKIDKEIDSFSPRIEAIEKQKQKAAKVCKRIEDEVAELDQKLLDSQQKRQSFELQIKELSDKLTEISKKNKEITSEKELKALSIEEDIAKEKLSFANEEIARLGEVEQKQIELKAQKKEEMDEAAAKLKSVEETTQEESKEIEALKATLYTQREKLVGQIDQKVSSYYEKIRAWAGNSAVSVVKKQACYGCFMKINDKTYAEVIAAQEITNCPHCGRILYKEEAEA